MRLLLYRYSYGEFQTIGKLYLLDENDAVIASWDSLELPWKNNQVKISCIPEMILKCSKHISPKFGRCLWVREVPNRSEILIHPANFVRDLLGCIGIGKDLDYIDKDSKIDVSSSRDALDDLLSYLINVDSIMLEIKSNETSKGKL